MNINEEYAGVVPSILVTPVNLKLKMKSKKEKNRPAPLKKKTHKEFLKFKNTFTKQKQ